MDQMKIKHENDVKLHKKELEEAKIELKMMKTKFEEEKQINNNLGLNHLNGFSIICINLLKIWRLSEC